MTLKDAVSRRAIERIDNDALDNQNAIQAMLGTVYCGEKYRFERYTDSPPRRTITMPVSSPGVFRMRLPEAV